MEENWRNELGYGNAAEHQKYKSFLHKDNLAKRVVRGNLFLPMLDRTAEPTWQSYELAGRREHCQTYQQKPNPETGEEEIAYETEFLNCCISF